MGCGSWVGFKVSMVCGVVSVVGTNFGGYGLLLVVAGDGYLVVICYVGWDLVGFGFVISICCYNGGFGGLVCCLAKSTFWSLHFHTIPTLVPIFYFYRF